MTYIIFANQTYSADNFALAENNLVLTQFQGVFVDLVKALYWLGPHDGLIWCDYHSVRTPSLPSNAQTLTNIQKQVSGSQCTDTDSCHIVWLTHIMLTASIQSRTAEVTSSALIVSAIIMVLHHYKMHSMCLDGCKNISWYWKGQLTNVFVCNLHDNVEIF